MDKIIKVIKDFGEGMYWLGFYEGRSEYKEVENQRDLSKRDLIYIQQALKDIEIRLELGDLYEQDRENSSTR